MHRLFALLVLVLAACDIAPPAATVSGAPPPGLSPEQAAKAFVEVVRAVEPVAEQECQRRTAGVRCDFAIIVDRDPRAGANAFQSENEAGQPVVTFTIAMIAQARNADEMAFVLSHEASHHILGHLARQADHAAAGAAIFADLATRTGGNAADVAKAQQIGAVVGARSYSKNFELEADQLGTVIALRAGYDPLKGATYFTRIPDPGNRFLGTHPPNAARLEAVSTTARLMAAPG